jgi:hypothetical protein
VIGGFAAVAHGVTLLTQDVEMICQHSAEAMPIRSGIRAPLGG